MPTYFACPDLHGKKFQVVGDAQTDPNIEFTCISLAANDTFLVVGINFDSVNNRTLVTTHKFKNVRFKGEVVIP